MGITNDILDHELKLDRDAFAHSQIASKLALCHKFEYHVTTHGRADDGGPICNIAILGGWYGTLAHMLLIRDESLPHIHIDSYDIDPYATKMANAYNEAWVVWNQFQAICADANTVDLRKYHAVINTSTEHFISTDWFHNIPKGTFVMIQSNDLVHRDHHQTCEKLSDMMKLYPLDTPGGSESIPFEYKEVKFQRFMSWGIKYDIDAWQ